MNTFIASLAAVNQTPLDWDGNYKRILEAIEKADEIQSDFLCTPELGLTGYGCEDYFYRPDLYTRALNQLDQLRNALAQAHPNLVCSVGLPMIIEGEAYNCLAVLQGNMIRGIIPKSHLARDGIHYEPRWFRPWKEGRYTQLNLFHHEVPVGNLIFNLNGYHFGFEICEDAWVSDDRRPCRIHAGKIHAVFNASASHFSFGKSQQRDRILEHSSDVFGFHYYYANLSGCESGRAIYDGELMVAENGKVVNRSPRLGVDNVLILSHKVLYEPSSVEKCIILKTIRPENRTIPAPSLERSFPSREHEFAAAASLGLFDYMRKSKSMGFTISLSGGVDSAVCVILTAMALNRIKKLRDKNDPRVAYLGSMKEPIITTVYQSTRNSGEITRRAAYDLANKLGTRHFEMDVDPLVEAYKDLVSNAIGRKLSWQNDDLVLQNIQARTRGPGVWMLANMTRSLLITTSNRSEVAVGYATMDGDTCGGLAPIAGVEKTFLRSWLNSLEHTDMPFCGSIPELKAINRQNPTAELRPPSEHQSDETDLMPYEILDALEEGLIMKRQTPMETYRQILPIFSKRWSSVQLKEWTIRFLKLFSISQWKRERYAPSFHLDDRSLDPKTWARFPILSGGFVKEIEEFIREVEEEDY